MQTIETTQTAHSGNTYLRTILRAGWLPVIVVAVVSLTGTTAAAQSRNEAILSPGQTAPDGNGTFNFLDLPTINSSGQIAFFGTLDGTLGGLRRFQGDLFC